VCVYIHINAHTLNLRDTYVSLFDLCLSLIAVLYLLALIRVRSHYSVDIFLAIAVGLVRNVCILYIVYTSIYHTHILYVHGCSFIQLSLTNDRLDRFGVSLLHKPYTQDDDPVSEEEPPVESPAMNGVAREHQSPGGHAKGSTSKEGDANRASDTD
jgi:hypothetical protein